MKSKILRITSTYGVGGAGTTALKINDAVNRYSSYESHIFSPRKTLKVMDICSNPYTKFDLYFSYLKTTLLGLDSIYSPKWMRFFKRVYRHFDLIHLHHLQGYFFDIRCLQLIYHMPVVITLHDYWPITGRCSFPDGCDIWQRSCHNCQFRKHYPHTYIDNSRFLHEQKKYYFSLLKQLRVVANSKMMHDEIGRSHLASAERTLIHNGIDTDVFFPRPRPAGRGPIKIGVIGNKLQLSWKGRDELINLLKHIKESNLGSKYHLIIAGHLDREQIELAKNYEFVDYHNFMNSAESVAQLYNEMDVFLNLSRQESFGKTTVEAQACGTPVLTRALDVFRETNLFGDFFTDDHPAVLLQRVDNISGRTYHRDEMFTKIDELFSVKAMAQKYITLYDSLLNRV